MGSTEERVVAVIMVGGPTKGTRFRPLSLNIPKPLIPLAGLPMIPNLVQVYLIGFYEEREFALYVSAISNELRLPVRYLKEDKPHGSAGGLYSFRDYIMEDDPSHIVLLNCDVCSSFPLPDMLGVTIDLKPLDGLGKRPACLYKYLEVGLFFYDIFWVFFTPVMVSVANSFDAPIKLLFPTSDAARPFSMLGLGDIVIPALRFDVSRGKQACYFNIAFLGYTVGLVLTIIVMNWFQAAQLFGVR